MPRGTSSEFVRFVGANLVAALVNITTKLLSGFLLIDPLAVLAGFCAGLSTSYLLCRSYVFRTASASNISELARFTGVNLAALGITFATYRQMLHVLQASAHMDIRLPGTQVLAHTVGVGAPVIFSFIAQKTLTFRQRLG